MIVDADAEEEDEPAKQVNVTFARQVPDFIKKMREQSFQTHAKKSLEEQWIECDYKPVNSNLAEVYLNFVIKTKNILFS